MKDLIADAAYDVFDEPRARATSLVALCLIAIGVIVGVAFDDKIASVPLVVVGSGMFFLGTLMPTLTEFQIGPTGFSAKLRGRDEDFRAILGADAEGLVRTGTWLAGGPEAGRDLAERALIETYIRWPRERPADPAGMVRERMVELAPAPRETPPAPTQPGQAGRADELLAKLISLPVGERSAVVLHLLEGMDAQAVASITRQEPATVAADLARGAAQIASAAGATPGEAR